MTAVGVVAVRIARCLSLGMMILTIDSVAELKRKDRAHALRLAKAAGGFETARLPGQTNLAGGALWERARRVVLLGKEWPEDEFQKEV